DNLSGDAQHCRPRVVADGVEATIGLHTLQRSRPTKTAGALDHQRAGPGQRGADRRSDASGTAADHYDIVALDVVRHANYTITLVSDIRGRGCNVRLWHLADITIALPNVRFWGKSG